MSKDLNLQLPTPAVVATHEEQPKTNGPKIVGFEPLPIFVWFLAVLAATLFVAGSVIFGFQGLRNVPVYGTSGGMHIFVERIEGQLEEAEQLLVSTDDVDNLEPWLKALERFSILTARDFLRDKRSGGLDGLDKRSYSETEAAMAEFCDAAATTRTQSFPDCKPEPLCEGYSAWAKSMDLSMLSGADRLDRVPSAQTGANSLTFALPSARALLGCSQRGLQVVADFTRNETSRPERVVAKAIEAASVRYPGLSVSTWPQVRSFIDSYRILVPKGSLIKAQVHPQAEPMTVSSFIATLWSALWLTYLWVPLFIIYIALAGCCGAISNVVRGCTSEFEAGNPSQLALQGGAAAWFGVMLVMVGFTLTGVTGAVVNKIPEPSIVVVISFIAGLNANAVNAALANITRGFFAPRPSS